LNETLKLMANETDLAARAADEAAAFAAIYDHYFPRVYNYVRYRVRDLDLTDELTSLIFERALTRISTFQPEKAPFGAWLFAIARHAIQDHFRAERRRRWLSLDFFVEHPSPGVLPEEAADQADTIQRMLNAVSQLDAREQDLIALKFTSRLDNVQIARITGLSESNVGVILYRALRRLRTLLNGKENSYDR
jgi:RNA polymerase sigma-70 factor (ECF subfamily)